MLHLQQPQQPALPVEVRLQPALTLQFQPHSGVHLYYMESLESSLLAIPFHFQGQIDCQWFADKDGAKIILMWH